MPMNHMSTTIASELVMDMPKVATSVVVQTTHSAFQKCRSYYCTVKCVLHLLNISLLVKDPLLNLKLDFDSLWFY